MTLQEIQADIREQLKVAGDDSDRRKNALEDGVQRLPGALPFLIKPRRWRAAIDEAEQVRVVEAATQADTSDVAQQILMDATEELGTPAIETGNAWPETPPAERSWVIPHWLPAGRIALLVGQGSTGKSRLALQLAAAIASGHRDWLPGTADSVKLPADEPATAVLCSWEDEKDEIARRLCGMGKTGTVGDRLRFLGATAPLWEPRQGGSRHTSTLGELSAAGEWVRAYCEQRQARLLVLDPLAAVYACNENDRGLVRAFMASWDRWAQQAACAVLLIAHPPKSHADFSGSTDWHAAARAVWALGLEETHTDKAGTGKKKEPAPAMQLRCVKSSYGRLPAPHWLAGWPGWRVEEDAQKAAADRRRVIEKEPDHTAQEDTEYV